MARGHRRRTDLVALHHLEVLGISASFVKRTYSSFAVLVGEVVRVSAFDVRFGRLTLESGEFCSPITSDSARYTSSRMSVMSRRDKRTSRGATRRTRTPC